MIRETGDGRISLIDLTMSFEFLGLKGEIHAVDRPVFSFVQ